MSKQSIISQVNEPAKQSVTSQVNEPATSFHVAQSYGVLSDDDIVTKVELSPGTQRSKLLEERNCSGQVPLMYIY